MRSRGSPGSGSLTLGKVKSDFIDQHKRASPERMCDLLTWELLDASYFEYSGQGCTL